MAEIIKYSTFEEAKIANNATVITNTEAHREYESFISLLQNALSEKKKIKHIAKMNENG
jgi:hypothetical protein